MEGLEGVSKIKWIDFATSQHGKLFTATRFQLDHRNYLVKN